MSRSIVLKSSILAACCAPLILAGCSTAKVVSDIPQATDPSVRPPSIYVADFELQDGAVTSGSPLARLPLHRMREQSQAHALATALGNEVVEDLVKKGVSARRLAHNEAIPTQGWLLSGTIQRIDEGDRLRRAVVGFGSGATDLKVAIEIENLSVARAPTQLDQVQTDARSGKAPGAILTVNPYAAAVKFVLSSRDLGQNTRKTAGQIADRVAFHVNAAGQATPPT
jgi:hypothetical protein